MQPSSYHNNFIPLNSTANLRYSDDNIEDPKILRCLELRYELYAACTKEEGLKILLEVEKGKVELFINKLDRRKLKGPVKKLVKMFIERIYAARGCIVE